MHFIKESLYFLTMAMCCVLPSWSYSCIMLVAMSFQCKATRRARCTSTLQYAPDTARPAPRDCASCVLGISMEQDRGWRAGIRKVSNYVIVTQGHRMPKATTLDVSVSGCFTLAFGGLKLLCSKLHITREVVGGKWKSWPPHACMILRFFDSGSPTYKGAASITCKEPRPSRQVKKRLSCAVLMLEVVGRFTARSPSSDRYAVRILNYVASC